MNEWEEFYDTLSKEERLYVWKRLAQKMGYGDEIKNKLVIYSPTLYRFHQALVMPWRNSFNMVLTRLLLIFTIVSLFLLFVNDEQLAHTAIAIIVIGNLAISIALVGIIHITEFIVGYLRG